jgi:hypothetical protein
MRCALCLRLVMASCSAPPMRLTLFLVPADPTAFFLSKKKFPNLRPRQGYVPCKRHRGGPCWAISDRGLLRLARQSKRPEAGIEGAILQSHRQPRQDASRSAPVRMADEWYAWNLERATALGVRDGHMVCNTPLWAPLTHSDSVRQAQAQVRTSGTSCLRAPKKHLLCELALARQTHPASRVRISCLLLKMNRI